jgi:hypothetical protein
MNSPKAFTAPFLTAFIVATLAPIPRALAQTPEPGAQAQAPGSADDNDEARRLYRSGVAAFDADKPEEARKLLLQAWSIRRTYDVASVLGQIELILNLPRDAAEHLDFAIRNFPPQLSADALQRVRDTYSQAEKRVGILIVRSDRPGTRVLVDGEPVGVSPLTTPLFLEPGSHKIEGENGGARVERTVLAEAGATQSLGLELGKNSPAKVTPVPARESSIRPVSLIVGGTIVLVGSALGVGFAMSAASARDRGDALRASLADGDCAPGRAISPSCGALRKAGEDHDRDRNIATASFVVAGAALAATAAYWFLGSSDEPASGGSPARVRIGATVAKREGALWLTGAF